MNGGETPVQFHKSTDCAIRILHYIHNHTNYRDDIPKAQTISKAVGITYPYFIKVSNQLRSKGLLLSTQGRNGGYQIARPAHKINLYDVVLAMEGELKISHCFETDTQQDRKAEHCALQDYYKDIREMLIAKLSGTCIADFGMIRH